MLTLQLREFCVLFQQLLLKSCQRHNCDITFFDNHVYVHINIKAFSLTHSPKHHHHKHQGLGTLIRSVSRVATALANFSSVFQLFSFFVVCSDMISKGFDLVAFFASVKASSVCINLLNPELNPIC